MYPGFARALRSVYPCPFNASHDVTANDFVTFLLDFHTCADHEIHFHPRTMSRQSLFEGYRPVRMMSFCLAKIKFDNQKTWCTTRV